MTRAGVMIASLAVSSIGPTPALSADRLWNTCNGLNTKPVLFEQMVILTHGEVIDLEDITTPDHPVGPIVCHFTAVYSDGARIPGTLTIGARKNVIGKDMVEWQADRSKSKSSR